MGGSGASKRDSDSEQEARRRGLGNSADRRPARTRERLIGALDELLESDRPVSVAAVCERAGVGRSTFYTHFATVGDVVVHVVDTVFDDLGRRDVLRRSEKVMARRAITEIGIDELLHALAARRRFFAYAMSAHATARVRDRLLASVTTSIRGSVLAERPDAGEHFVRTACDFIAGGIVEVLLGRIDDARDLEDSTLARDVIEMLPSWLTNDDPTRV